MVDIDPVVVELPGTHHAEPLALRLLVPTDMYQREAESSKRSKWSVRAATIAS